MGCRIGAGTWWRLLNGADDVGARGWGLRDDASEAVPVGSVCRVGALGELGVGEDLLRVGRRGADNARERAKRSAAAARNALDVFKPGFGAEGRA